MSTQQPDSAFGQTLQSLRTALSLSRAGLANELGVSRQAVGAWEAGRSYPKAEHLKALISLGVQSQAFEAGRETEEIRVLWKAACQKVPLDESWLATLLSGRHPRHLRLLPPPVEEKSGPIDLFWGPETLVDWGEALAVPAFYGREEELALLSEWIVQEHCRVVSVLGMGGIGKSALSVNAMYRLARHFEVVIFRTLRDAPSCEVLLDDCLQVLSPQLLRAVPASLGPRISFLLEHLRKTRVLLVLDNLECLLATGDPQGHFSPGFEEYGQLLHRVAERGHQSCLLFTSREQPADLRELSGRYPQVHSLHLTGLDAAACKPLLEEKELSGTEAEEACLIEAYSGNPLALRIVTETIVDLFGGEIGLFLGVSTVIFGSITDLLDEQFARLSAIEKTVLYWLAISREPITLDELLTMLVIPKPPVQLLEAVDGLRRRSLIERGKRSGSFTLQSVVLEYVTAHLVAEGGQEIKLGRLNRLIEHGLCLAHAKEYVRQAQERLLLSPLLANLQSAYFGQIGELQKAEARSERGPVSTVAAIKTIEDTLLGLLDELREQEDYAQGYGSANLIALLHLLRGNLNALDLSQLCIREVYLQGSEMHDASVAGALIRDCIWTSAASAIWSVAMSGNGKWWACGGNQGQMRVWEGVQSPTLHLVWQAHTDIVWALAFSPDGQLLASGSQDGTVKLWDVESGTLLWTARQYHPLSLAFSPDGHLFASGGNDASVRLWDVTSGRNLHTLTHKSHVWAVAWSPDGSLLAGGGKGGEICLWERQKGTDLAFVPLFSIQTTNWVSSLAFDPSGRTLASTSWGDQTVKLWEVGSHEAAPRGQLREILPGYTDKPRCVAWSPDGRILAYSNPDKGICFFDVEEGRIRSVLHGHSTDVYGMAFTPDGTRLLSGSADGTLRVWDVENYRCVRVTAGYVVSLWDFDWSPASTHLVSGDTDGQVTLWDIGGATPPRVLYSHTWIVEGVGWSPDGRYIASCGIDGVLCLWDPTSHTLVHRFENPKIVLLGLAWSPDGSELAYGTYGQGIQVWNARTHCLRFVGQTHPHGLWSIAWSPNGMQLVGGDDDGGLYVWESRERNGQAQDKAPLSLLGHQGRVMGLAWSPDGKRLASGSGNSSSGELFLWDVERGVRVQTFEGHPGMIYALAWYRRRDGVGAHPGIGARRDQLISGGSDGILRWWDVETAECINMQEAHQGTIRSLKVSPDGKFLASCGDDGATEIWDLTRNAHLRTLRRDRPYERLNITGIRGLNAAQIASLRALGAIENPSQAFSSAT